MTTLKLNFGVKIFLLLLLLSPSRSISFKDLQRVADFLASKIFPLGAKAELAAQPAILE